MTRISTQKYLNSSRRVKRPKSWTSRIGSWRVAATRAVRSARSRVHQSKIFIIPLWIRRASSKQIAGIMIYVKSRPIASKGPRTLGSLKNSTACGKEVHCKFATSRTMTSLKKRRINLWLIYQRRSEISTLARILTEMEIVCYVPITRLALNTFKELRVLST